jgi:predicted TIM-barrel fold metal-dependent hydrolase
MVAVQSEYAPTPARYFALSSDTHIIEPADLFTTRMPASYRDDAPQIAIVDGIERWSAEGIAFHPSTSAFAPGDRFLPVEKRPVRSPVFAEAIEESAYVASAWLAENERDGVYGGVVVPSSTLAVYGVRSSRLLDEILAVYNDWIGEFASYAPGRIKPIGLLNPDDIPRAVRAAENLKARGFAGVMLPVKMHDGHTYESADYDPLWEAVAGLRLPVSMHVACHRTPGDASQILGNRGARLSLPVNAVDHHIRIALTDMVYGGAFERYPDLRVCSVEHEGSWVFHLLQRLDWTYRYDRRYSQLARRFPDGSLPSDYVRRNVVICFTEDPFLVQNRHVLGVDNLAWGSDFPHPESPFTHSDDSLADQLAGVPDEERMKMTVGNTARLYGFDLPPERQPGAASR